MSHIVYMMPAAALVFLGAALVLRLAIFVIVNVVVPFTDYLGHADGEDEEV